MFYKVYPVTKFHSCAPQGHRSQKLVMMLCHITGGTRGCHNDNYCLPVETKFPSWHLLVFSGLIDQEAVSYQAMAGCQICDRPFPEPIKMAKFCDAILWYLTTMGCCTGFIFHKGTFDQARTALMEFPGIRLRLLPKLATSWQQWALTNCS